MGNVTRHKLNVDLTELIEAMDNASYELIYVLDLETGKVLWTSDEDRREVERIWAKIEGAATADFSAFQEALARRDLQDWERQSVLEAARIEEGFGTRYRRIEPEDSPTGYRDMEAFVDTVEDAALREKLEQAIRGRGAFNRFKAVLLDYQDESERWFEFKQMRLRQRALEWLHLDPPGHPSPQPAPARELLPPTSG